MTCDKLGCVKCGECCRQLYLYDMVMISVYTGTWMFNRTCSFLKGGLCLIQDKKPGVCRNWLCSCGEMIA